jgi:hypothetical protein
MAIDRLARTIESNLPWLQKNQERLAKEYEDYPHKVTKRNLSLSSNRLNIALFILENKEDVIKRNAYQTAALLLLDLRDLARTLEPAEKREVRNSINNFRQVFRDSGLTGIHPQLWVPVFADGEMAYEHKEYFSSLVRLKK